MNIVTAEELTLNYGPREILRGEGFAVTQGEKVGLIGANGTGKSTLLRAMMGITPLDSGAFHFAKGATVGYLPQDVNELPKGTLLRSVMEAAPGLSDVESQLSQTEMSLQSAKDPETQSRLAQRLADLHHVREMWQQQYSEAEAETILLGLGFHREDYPRPLAEFSGGWKTRAALAGLLFRKPDLLLLDEPTNHLDVPTVAWFDEFLINWPKAVVLVTHDRHFLDRQVQRILSFEFEGLRSYTGNYSGYLKLREEEERLLMARKRNVEDRKRQATRFINRFRAKNTKATQVQSRIKELEKLQEIELPKDRRKLSFTFDPTVRGAKETIRVEKLSKSFPRVKLFENLDLVVYRGDRIGIVGVNGAGKTTLLKMIAKELEPDNGQVVVGPNVEASYYAQHQSDLLDEKKTVLEEVWSVVPNTTMTYIRNVCGSFLFTGDEVEKPVGVLSGGEKARVSLARILVRPGNLLLMDEPTNHLDIWSSEALGQALESYDGTLIFVSHNRGFVNRLANKIWDIREGRIEQFPGNLDDYLYHRSLSKKERDQAAEKTGPKNSEAAPSTEKIDKKAQKRAEAELRQKVYKVISPIKTKVAALEKEIEDMETEYDRLQSILADPTIYEDSEKSVPLLSEFEKIKQRLDRKMVEWEAQTEKLTKACEELGVDPD